MQRFIESSAPVPVKSERSELGGINIFYQFFIPDNDGRRMEIRHCLRRNADNPCIDNIYLLNERVYTAEELGCDSEKIHQHNIGRRMRFSDFFQYSQDEAIEGYNILINADIFFDEGVDRLRNSAIDTGKKALAQLRYEYRGESDLNLCNLFGSKEFYIKQHNMKHPGVPLSLDIEQYRFRCRADSMDTWIIHSSNKLSKKEIGLFRFELGTPACDNKFIYLFRLLGYDIYNDPQFLRTYHYHTAVERSYTVKDRLPAPWMLLLPAGFKYTDSRLSLGINIPILGATPKIFTTYHFAGANRSLGSYIAEKRMNDVPFVLPRIAGVENECAMAGALIRRGTISSDTFNDSGAYTRLQGTMKFNAGVKITSYASMINYAKRYHAAFSACDRYLSWEPWGDVYRWIEKSHQYIETEYPSKAGIWALAMDIYHYVHHNPWTLSLRGCRLLIVSPFADSMREKVPHLTDVYGIDLFPECTFTFIKPPQTQGHQPSKEWSIELDAFCERLQEVRDEFDVALCSCGGYGNPVCSFIYSQLGKSAIYVGGVLQMYFGIYGARWLRERKDVLLLFMNEHWSRPSEAERPISSQSIENNCYW